MVALESTPKGYGYHRLRPAGLGQPFSIFLPWRNPWNNFQVWGNPCLKIIISTAWSVSCRYNNPIIIVNAILSREWYFSVDLFILANKFKKLCLFFFQSRSLAEPLATSRGTPSDISRNPRVEKPWSRVNPFWSSILSFTFSSVRNACRVDAMITLVRKLEQNGSLGR
jgi:hypothetical protein